VLSGDCSRASDGIFGLHHDGKAVCNSPDHDIGEPDRVVSKERGRIAETEIEVAMTVHIGQVATLHILREQ